MHYRFSEIRAHRSKSTKGDWLSRNVVWRPYSIYVSWALANLGVRSVGVAAANIVVIAAASYLLFDNAKWALIVGGLGVQLYWLLDHVDGELARFEMAGLGRRNSRIGHYLDLFAHKVSVVALFAMGWAVAGATGDDTYTLLGFAVGFFVLGPAVEPAKDIVLGAKRTEETEKAARKIRALGVERGANTGAGPVLRAALALNDIVGFPGWLLLITIACLLDAFLPPLRAGGAELYYRGMLLIALAPIYAVKFVFAFQWYARIMLATRHD